MAKIIDGTIFFITYFLVFYSILSRYTSFKYAVPLIIGIYILLATLNFYFKARHKKSGITAEETPTYLALMDRLEQTKLFWNMVPDDLKGNIIHPYFTYQRDGKTVLVAVLYRFMNLTQEDIASAYREAVKQEANEVVMLTRARDRKTLTLTTLLPIKFSFPDKFTVFKALKKHNALPKKPMLNKAKNKEKVPLKEVLDIVFTRTRARYFLFTALVLIIFSFLTPLKNYYLIASLVPFTFSAICFFKSFYLCL